MQPTTRLATNGDLEVLAQFQRNLVEYERPMDSTIAVDADGYYDIESLLTDPDTHLLVAEDAGSLSGCSFGQIRPADHWAAHERIGYIGMVYVHDDYRGRGICSMMFERLEAWFRSRAVHELRLEAYARNPSAHKAYLKSGFEPHLIQMRRSLE